MTDFLIRFLAFIVAGMLTAMTVIILDLLIRTPQAKEYRPLTTTEILMAVVLLVGFPAATLGAWFVFFRL